MCLSGEPVAFANQLPNLRCCTALSRCSSQCCSAMAHSGFNMYFHCPKKPTSTKPKRCLSPMLYVLYAICKKKKKYIYHQNWLCFPEVPLTHEVFVFSVSLHTALCTSPKLTGKKLVLSFLKKITIILKSLSTQHYFSFYSSPTSRQIASVFMLYHLTNAC